MTKTTFLTESEARQLMQEHGSPLYVYNEQIIRDRVNAFQHAFRGWSKTQLLYACKANSNPHILQILREEGAWLDCVSPYEVELGLLAGFSPEHIMFTVNNMTDEDMHFAVQKGVLLNIDALSRLENFGKAYPGSRVCIRLTPGVVGGHHEKVQTGVKETKFGILIDDIPRALAIAQQYGLRIIGLHEHTGSGSVLSKLIQSMKNIMSAAYLFPDLEFLDFGGGFKIPYQENEERLDLEAFGQEIVPLFRQFCETYGRELGLYFEPGRYFVAEAGVLLSTVNTIKERDNQTMIGIDTGFNHLMRPVMYGSYHHISNLSNPSGVDREYTIAGNLCESGDVFARQRFLPLVQEGNVIAIHDVGAYGMSMASNYNSRPLPPELLLTLNGGVQVIRRRQTFADIIGQFAIVQPEQEEQVQE